MPATSVMTTEQTKVTRRRPASEDRRHHVPARPLDPEPIAGAPAIALVTTGAHTGCPLVTADELGVPVAGWTYCGPDGDGPAFADTVAAFAQADGVGAIAACVDAIGTDLDGRALMRAAEAAADAGRPLVVLATGADRVIDAVLRQAGVIRVDGFDQLLDCAATLARFPRPAQRPGPVRVAADSGGAATLLAELARRAGLEVEDAGHTPDVAEIAARPGAGMLLYAVTETGSSGESTAAALVEAARESATPIGVVWCSSGGTETGYRLILQRSPEIATFRTLTNAVAAAKAYYDHCDYRFRIPSLVEDNAMAGVKARQILTSGGAPGAARKKETDPSKGLSESQTHQLLRAYGIRTPREQLVTSAAWAVRAAATIGYPVVMKASVAGLPSASAAGLTRTTITSASQVRENFKDLMDSAGRQGYGTLDGVLIGQQITGGVDTMVGIRRDDRFGPAVVVGVGGAYAETLGDVAIRVAPFDAYQAHRMLEELHCLPLLTTAGADLEALADTILRVQRMALDLGDVLEGFDIAPLRVLGRGGGTVALDASARLIAR
jgi:acetate---CoA ligase (ADP-forming)